MTHAFASTKKSLGRSLGFYSLPELAKQFPNVNRMPISLRIVLESVLRNCDGQKVTAEHVVARPRAALVRHVHDVHLSHRFEQLARHVIRRARS